MKCPYCGNEMTKGFIQGRSDFFFTQKPQRFLVAPQGEDIALSDNRVLYITGGPKCEAYCCRDCKRVIVDYRLEKSE